MDATITNETILALADSRATLETVGGKGASLARLITAGLPVPGGFHVTTTAYRQFVDQNGLQPRILEILTRVDLSQPSSLEKVSREIQDAFAQATVPIEIGEAIERAYAEFPGVETPVAVRSSATAEDLPELSFAGQQETFLNIWGVQAVQEAVKRCWASLWTARAIGYRMQHQIDQEAVSLAVVVQEMIAAEAAGILFTANPLNGQRDQMLINAAWGLGEAIVGGLVTPDTISLEKDSGRVIDRQIADKQVMTVGISGTTQNQPVPEELRRAPVLGDEDVTALARLGVQIEDLYEKPMDIEWALRNGKLAILQARPITALVEEEEAITIEWKLPNPKGIYMRGSAVDLMPDPLSPLFEIDGDPRIGVRGKSPGQGGDAHRAGLTEGLLYDD